MTRPCGYFSGMASTRASNGDLAAAAFSTICPITALSLTACFMEVITCWGVMSDLIIFKHSPMNSVARSWYCRFWSLSLPLPNGLGVGTGLILSPSKGVLMRRMARRSAGGRLSIGPKRLVLHLSSSAQRL
jgi:hypothetical protein